MSPLTQCVNYSDIVPTTNHYGNMRDHDAALGTYRFNISAYW